MTLTTLSNSSPPSTLESWKSKTNLTTKYDKMVPFKSLCRLLYQTNSVLSYPLKHWIIFQFSSFLRNWIGPKVTEFLAYWVSEALLVLVEIHLRPMCTNWLCMPIILILAALDCWLLCLFWLEVSLAASWIAMHRQVRERFAGVWFSFLDPLQTSWWLTIRCRTKFSIFT